MSLLTHRPAAHTDTKQAVTGRDGVKINSVFILVPLVIQILPYNFNL